MVEKAIAEMTCRERLLEIEYELSQFGPYGSRMNRMRRLCTDLPADDRWIAGPPPKVGSGRDFIVEIDFNLRRHGTVGIAYWNQPSCRELILKGYGPVNLDCIIRHQPYTPPEGGTGSMPWGMACE